MPSGKVLNNTTNSLIELYLKERQRAELLNPNPGCSDDPLPQPASKPLELTQSILSQVRSMPKSIKKQEKIFMPFRLVGSFEDVSKSAHLRYININHTQIMSQDSREIPRTPLRML